MVNANKELSVEQIYGRRCDVLCESYYPSHPFSSVHGTVPATDSINIKIRLPLRQQRRASHSHSLLKFHRKSLRPTAEKQRETAKETRNGKTNENSHNKSLLIFSVGVGNRA